MKVRPHATRPRPRQQRAASGNQHRHADGRFRPLRQREQVRNGRIGMCREVKQLLGMSRTVRSLAQQMRHPIAQIAIPLAETFVSTNTGGGRLLPPSQSANFVQQREKAACVEKRPVQKIRHSSIGISPPCGGAMPNDGRAPSIELRHRQIVARENNCKDASNSREVAVQQIAAH